MSKGPPTKPPKKKADLGPIDDSDVEAAFSHIRLESEPVGKDNVTNVDRRFSSTSDDDEDEDDPGTITGADELTDVGPDDLIAGSEFAPEHTDLAGIRKADSPSRRAQTNPAILDEIVDEKFERAVPQIDRMPARSATQLPGRFNVSVPKTIPPPNKSGDKPGTAATKSAKPITGDASMDDPPTDAWAGTKYESIPSGRAQSRAFTQVGGEVLTKRSPQDRAMTAAEKAAHAAKSRLAAKQGQAAPSTSPSPRQPTQASPAVRQVAQRQPTQAASTVQRPPQAAPAPASPTPPRTTASVVQRAPTPTSTTPPRTTASVVQRAPQPQRTSAPMAAQTPQQTGPVQRPSAPAIEQPPQQTGPVQRTSASMAAQAPQQTGPVQRTTASIAAQAPQPPQPQPQPRTTPPGPPPGSRVERLPLPPPRPDSAAWNDSQAYDALAVLSDPLASGRAESRAQSFDIDVGDLAGGRGGTLDRALDHALETRDEDVEAAEHADQDALERALADEDDDGDDDFGVLADPLPPAPEKKPAAPARLPRVDLSAGNKQQPPLPAKAPPAKAPPVTPAPAEVANAAVHSADYAIEVPNPLRVAVHETAPNLQSAGLAIAGAGHLMVLGASGREGLAKIQQACAQGQIDAVIVGLPGGEWLISAALSLGAQAPIVIAACDGKPTEAIFASSAAGASLVAMRPHDPGRIAPVLLAASRMAENRRDIIEAREKEASLISRLDSQAEGHEAELGDLQPFEQFKRTLELELKRVKRYQYALSVALFALEVPDPAPPGVRGLLRARAGNALVQSIRDIDMATELENDRFLVLLPYTDLTGGTHVARRILAAVDALPPITMGGVTVQAQLTGAIAGAKPGAQVSLGKLLRDANRALEAARRDGAELAVQP